MRAFVSIGIKTVYLKISQCLKSTNKYSNFSIIVRCVGKLSKGSYRRQSHMTPACVISPFVSRYILLKGKMVIKGQKLFSYILPKIGRASRPSNPKKFLSFNETLLNIFS